MSMEKTKKYLFSSERKSRLTYIILLSVILPVMVFVVAPFEIYCNNIGEFQFSIVDVVLMQCIFALVIGAAIFLILYLVPKCVYEYAYPTFLGILIMLFVQTNYLNAGLNSLVGDDVQSGPGVFTYVFNTAVWVVVIALVILAYKLVKARHITSAVALVLTVAIGATQIMNFTIVSLSTEGEFDSALDRVYGEYAEKPKFLTNKDYEAFGSDSNVIVFCVDRFDTVLYAEPAMEEYSEIFEKFDGFTFYNDATSIYGNTFPAVGYMLSGIEYDHGDHRSWFYKVYNENQTISALHDLGYTVHMYSEPYYDYYNANELPSYVGNLVETDKENLEVVIRKPFKLSYNISKMSLYRSFPFILKNAVGKINSDTCNEYILYDSTELGGYKSFSYDLKKAYDEVKRHDGEFYAKSEKNFTFIHVSGCHSADYDDDWDRKHGIKTNKDYVASAKNSMEYIAAYLDNIKRISPEAYENSTVIILGDHGKVDRRTQLFDRAMLTAMFVKPAGVSEGDMRISSAPVSHDNLWATIFESEGIDYDKEKFGLSVFEVEDRVARGESVPDRRFIWNRRNPSLDSYDCVEYKIVGSARDFDNWSIEKTTYYNHPLFAN